MSRLLTLNTLRALIKDSRESLASIKALIDAGADLSLKLTPAEVLNSEEVANLHESTRRCLVDIGSGLNSDDCLGWAARMGRVDVVALLEREPYNLDVHRDHQNALFKASFYGHLAVVQHLLKSPGANPAAARHEEAQISPLSEASARGHLSIVAAFLDAGADPNSLNGMPILRACGAKPVSIPAVRLLLESGANVRAGCDDPARMALETNNMELLGLLIDYKADIWELAEDISGKNHVEAARLILERGHKFPVHDMTSSEIRVLVDSYMQK
ncbi:hypothetical protein HDU67_002594 [Dinochytrium kinnereticum]|nr:hypothetical protein HDU67_002594 [Dinochytrium kinnereticum]